MVRCGFEFYNMLYKKHVVILISDCGLFAKSHTCCMQPCILEKSEKTRKASHARHDDHDTRTINTTCL